MVTNVSADWDANVHWELDEMVRRYPNAEATMGDGRRVGEIGPNAAGRLLSPTTVKVCRFILVYCIYYTHYTIYYTILGSIVVPHIVFRLALFLFHPNGEVEMMTHCFIFCTHSTSISLSSSSQHQHIIMGGVGGGSYYYI